MPRTFKAIVGMMLYVGFIATVYPLPLWRFGVAVAILSMMNLIATSDEF